MPKPLDSNPPTPPTTSPDDPPSWGWEKYNCFRATFLYLFRPEDRATFVHCGRVLYNLITDGPPQGADDPESSTASEIRAAAQDLRHLGAFLASVGNEHHVSSLSLEDERLSLMAQGSAIEADRIAAEIEAVLNSRVSESSSGRAVRFKSSEAFRSGEDLPPGNARAAYFIYHALDLYDRGQSEGALDLLKPAKEMIVNDKELSRCCLYAEALAYAEQGRGQTAASLSFADLLAMKRDDVLRLLQEKIATP